MSGLLANICPECGAKIRCIPSVYGDSVYDCEPEKTVIISDMGRRHSGYRLHVCREREDEQKDSRSAAR